VVQRARRHRRHNLADGAGAALAEMALSFSTYEYFWLAFLGLMCATMVARSSPVKAIASMLHSRRSIAEGALPTGGSTRQSEAWEFL
jgi:hypothetical protein